MRLLTAWLRKGNNLAHFTFIFSTKYSSYYIIDAQWIDNDNVILNVINGNQRHLWIIACSLTTDSPYCTQVRLKYLNIARKTPMY